MGRWQPKRQLRMTEGASTAEAPPPFAAQTVPLPIASRWGGLILPQPRQCSRQPFGFCSFFGMVGTRFFDGFGLGLFNKSGVGEAACERVAFLGGGFDGFADAAAFGV